MSFTPRDAEEKRLRGGVITPASRDAEIKRITGAAVPTTAAKARDGEELRLASGSK